LLKPKLFKARQLVGKYRIQKRIANGPLAAVYQAFDTVLCRRVALKIPHAGLDPAILEDFRKEARLAVRLEHPNILPVFNASFIDSRFVIVTPLGEQTLADRLVKRMATTTALNLMGQALAAVAFAHSKRVIHCDIKPENFILFPGNRVRLGDFAFAKRCVRTIKASGSGTLGYIAPEQAMGRPMFQSDVFSLGLVMYRVFAGTLPEWPYSWPPPGLKRLENRLPEEFVAIVRRALKVKPTQRFRDAITMEKAFTNAIEKLSPEESTAKRRKRRN
jgi:serine/threonine protein kinase